MLGSSRRHSLAAQSQPALARLAVALLQGVGRVSAADAE